jgi:hypothetical protein
VESIPLTVIFLDSINTQGIKQETANKIAATRPIHFM